MPNKIKLWLLKYEQTVESTFQSDFINTQDEVRRWQNLLFIKFLVYCFPISFIAVVPCVYISFKVGYTVIGIVDILCFLLIVAITFFKHPELKYRKAAIIGIFYVLAIFLIYNLGYLGPGIFYLFALTILSALIFPARVAYFTIVFNAFIILCFAAIIYLNPANSAIGKEYTIGQWLAFSSNLIFLSIVLVLIIRKIFDGLQETIITTHEIKVNYKNIFEGSPLPMWLFDTNSLRFLDVNEAATEHYGYSKAEFMAMTIKDIRPAEYASGIEQVVKLHKETFKFHHDNIIHVKKNGEKINVKIESSLLDFNGYQAKLVLATDITAQIKSQQEIQKSNIKVKQSESNLRAIFDNTNEGFVLLDLDNCIIVFNSKAKESIIFNTSQIEFEEGKSIFDFVEEPRKFHFKDLIEKVHNGKVIEYDQNFYINDSMHWIRFTLTPVYEGGITAGICITGRDITEHKKYVQTIEEQNKTFREISWIQSHLVRAPLARVMGLTALLATETCEAEKEEILKLIQVSSLELDEIIKAITDKTAITNKVVSFPPLEQIV